MIKPIPALHPFYFLALMLIVGFCNNSHADQTDPRLDTLFADLVNAPNPGLAQSVQQEIWSVWFETEDAKAGEMLEAARQSAQTGSVTEAVVMFDTLVQTFPDWAEAWNQRAIVRYLMGDYEGSIEDVDRALDLEPRHFGAMSGRGQCLMQLERYDGALAAFENALAINPWLSSITQQIEMLKAILSTQPKAI